MTSSDSVLTEKMRDNLKEYKYNCRDTSPLANYVMHPFWDWLTQFYPLWLAPNLITFLGFLATLLQFFLLTYFDPNFDLPNNIPSIVWFLVAFLIFLAHTLDGTDGKQARRTNTSSPLGELFDHGCDSWSVYFIPVVVFNILGSYNLSAPWLFASMWILIWTFFCSHWEKYITGVLFLPWTYDLCQVLVTLACLLASIVGPDVYTTRIIGQWSIVEVMKMVIVAFVPIHIPCIIYNLLRECPSSQPWHRGLGCVEAFRPLIPILQLLFASTLWTFVSPTAILQTQPRLYLYCLATVSSNMCCCLITAQMCKIRAPVHNWLVTVYTLTPIVLLFISYTQLSAYWMASVELAFLVGLSGLVTVVHLDYCISLHFLDSGFTINLDELYNIWDLYSSLPHEPIPAFDLPSYPSCTPRSHISLESSVLTDLLRNVADEAASRNMRTVYVRKSPLPPPGQTVHLHGTSRADVANLEYIHVITIPDQQALVRWFANVHFAKRFADLIIVEDLHSYSCSNTTRPNISDLFRLTSLIEETRQFIHSSTDPASHGHNCRLLITCKLPSINTTLPLHGLSQTLMFQPNADTKDRFTFTSVDKGWQLGLKISHGDFFWTDYYSNDGVNTVT